MVQGRAPFSGTEFEPSESSPWQLMILYISQQNTPLPVKTLPPMRTSPCGSATTVFFWDWTRLARLLNVSRYSSWPSRGRIRPRGAFTRQVTQNPFSVECSYYTILPPACMVCSSRYLVVQRFLSCAFCETTGCPRVAAEEVCGVWSQSHPDGITNRKIFSEGETWKGLFQYA